MGIREKILEADDRPLREVVVPEWGLGPGEAFIRAMSPADYVDYRLAHREEFEELGRAGPRALADIVVRTLVDADGERILEDDDLEAILEKSGDVVLRLADQAAAVAGFDGAELEDAVGNSEPLPTSG